MGTTAEKIEYLNETKELIKQSLNDLGADIEDSNSFRSYVQKIKTLYEDWPKITAEGTFLSLNSTQKGKMKIELKGNTLQDGEPTPTNPVDINVVSGSNVIKTSNKNLFDKNSTVNGYFYTNSRIENVDWCYTRTILLKAGETYFTNQRAIISFWNGTTNLSYIDKNNSSFEVPANTTNVYISTLLINKETLQVEKGLTATTYEAHQGKELSLDLGSIELCKIGNYQDYFYRDNGKWYLHKEIGKYTLDGINNTFNAKTSATANNVFRTNQINDILPKNNITAVCSNFKSKGLADINSTDIIGFATRSDKIINFGFGLSSSINTLELATQFLQNNNVLIYYPLETATNTEITDTTLISQLEAMPNAISYNNQTNITQENNDLPFILNISALQKNSN